ncbi:hypothetical protein GQ457_01G055430 [Hibiscus cannabinus]
MGPISKKTVSFLTFGLQCGPKSIRVNGTRKPRPELSFINRHKTRNPSHFLLVPSGSFEVLQFIFLLELFGR